MVAWIYNSPIWLTGIVLLGIALLASSAGAVVSSLILPKQFRRAHNDVAAATLNIVGVVYAVLLAFIAVTTWQSFSTATDIANTEANYIGNLDRDSSAMPAPVATELRKQLRDYLDAVIGQEWPAQEAGGKSTAGWKFLEEFHVDITRFESRTNRETVIQAEILRTLNELYSARRNRLQAASGHVPEVVWWVIILGGALVIASTYLLGVERLWLQLLMTAAVTCSMTLAVILIIDLDYPFRGAPDVPGSLGVTDEPYTQVLHDMDALPNTVPGD